MQNIIIPAILETNYQDIIKYIDKYSKFSPRVQIDICDGVYVSAKTWLPNIYEDIKGYNLDLEFDMMVSDVREYLPILYYYDAKSIIIHINNYSDEEYIEIYKNIKKKNKLINVGVAISVKDELSRVIDNFAYIDYVQIMTIDSIGVQGSIMSEKQLAKVKILHQFFTAQNIIKTIQVDGGINHSTLISCKEAGANSFAIGSYLRSSQNQKESYVKLKNL